MLTHVDLSAAVQQLKANNAGLLEISSGSSLSDIDKIADSLIQPEQTTQTSDLVIVKYVDGTNTIKVTQQLRGKLNFAHDLPSCYTPSSNEPYFIGNEATIQVEFALTNTNKAQLKRAVISALQNTNFTGEIDEMVAQGLTTIRSTCYQWLMSEFSLAPNVAQIQPTAVNNKQLPHATLVGTYGYASAALSNNHMVRHSFIKMIERSHLLDIAAKPQLTKLLFSRLEVSDVPLKNSHFASSFVRGLSFELFYTTDTLINGLKF